MSKTFRKFPSAKDYSRNRTSYMKRRASKAVRKDWRVGNGRNFKKFFGSWDIVDYKWVLYNEKELFYCPWLETYRFEPRSKAIRHNKIYSRDTIRKDFYD